MAFAQDIGRSELEGLDIDQADLEAIITASQQESRQAEAEEHRMRAQAEEDTARALEVSRREAEALRLVHEDRELQEALSLSAAVVPPEPKLMDDEDAIQRAIRESEEEAKAAEQRRIEVMRTEDEGVLFQAALRASRVDLGPRGISQAAKIMATGDLNLGQADVVKKTNSHLGAGGIFQRVPSGKDLPAVGSGNATTTGTPGAEERARPSSNSSSLRDAGLSLATSTGQRHAASPAPKSLGHASPCPSGSVAVRAGSAEGGQRVPSKTRTTLAKARPAPR